MGLAIIFLLVTILGAFALLREARNKNMMAVGFAFITVAVFGFFSVMTIIDTIFGGGSSSGH